MKNCSMVQDLLPTYIEKLTSLETNEYIETHVKECSNCKELLDNMAEEMIEIEKIQVQPKEIQYLKKIHVRMILLKCALILLFCIILLLAGNMVRKMYILNEYAKTSMEVTSKTHFYIKIVEENQIYEIWRKGDIALSKSMSRRRQYYLELLGRRSENGEDRTNTIKSKRGSTIAKKRFTSQNDCFRKVTFKLMGINPNGNQE